MENFKRGFAQIQKLRKNETIRSLSLVLGLALLIITVWFDVPEFIAGIFKGVAICFILLGSRIPAQGESKKEKTGDQFWEQYLKKHPDLCKFIGDCKTYANSDCHKKSHEKCEIYLVKEWA